MKQDFSGPIPLWKFENLEAHPAIRHFVSGRAGGCSEGTLGALNLSYNVGDDPAAVAHNRALLAEAMKVVPGRLVFPVQTHSNHVQVVMSTTPPEQLAATDAVITAEPGLLIAVMSADCVPVLLYDPQNHVAAAIHAGWRGTMAAIVARTIDKMKSDFGTDPAHLLAGIGPSISPEVYQVGTEVLEAVQQLYGTCAGIIEGEADGKGFCNLWEANRRQLLTAGVKEANIEVAGLCTYKHADLFFSARHSQNRAGRFAAGLVLQ
jgi:YfiH family protein